MGPRLFRRGNKTDAESFFGRYAASMGPRLFRRGNNYPGIRHVRRLSGFNGATSFQTWKFLTFSPDSPIRVASMGPRLFRRGNTACIGLGDCARLASMGPRLFRRGNRSPSRLTAPNPSASMGHVFSDVEIFRRSCSFTGEFASMGPRLSDVEMRPGPVQIAERLWASMGPRLFRRGNPRCSRPAPRKKPCFNGATSFQTWKF